MLGRQVMESAVLCSVQHGGDTDVPSTCSYMVKVSLSPFWGMNSEATAAEFPGT